MSAPKSAPAGLRDTPYYTSPDVVPAPWNPDRPGMINEMLPRYLAVTPEQIRDAAQAVFRVDNRLVLTYLPEGPSAGDMTLDPGGEDQADDEEAAA